MLASCVGGKTSKSTKGDVDSVDFSANIDSSRLNSIPKKERAIRLYLAKMGKLKKINKNNDEYNFGGTWYFKNARFSALSSDATIIPTSPYGFYYYCYYGCHESGRIFAFRSSVDYEYFYKWMKKSGYSDNELTKDTIDYWYRISINNNQ